MSTQGWRKDPLDILAGKIEFVGECWEWGGARERGGYGHLGREGRTVTAHRFAYEMLVGPIPEGLELDHLCRNRACVNPDHLEPVTRKVNQERGVKAQRTRCLHGHPFDDENTLFLRESGRMCRTCAREAGARYRARKKAMVV